VDAAKRDLETYGDEQKQAIQNMIETCLVNLKPAVGDLWCLMCAMDESENDYSLQLENLNYHYRIGRRVNQFNKEVEQSKTKNKKPLLITSQLEQEFMRPFANPAISGRCIVQSVIKTGAVATAIVATTLY
jgi:hypothetical protein